MNNVNPINELTKFVGNRSLAAAARELKIAPSYLSNVLNGTQDFGPKLLSALGIVKVVAYKRIKPKG